jgi:uncharacterized protein YfcZ (UPF0381/DUF406 family)
LARILEDHADALKITEADTKTKWIPIIGKSLWAQESAGTQTFEYAKEIEADGTIKNGTTTIIKKNAATGKFDITLDTHEQAHIKTLLPKNTTISSDPAKVNPLFSQVFPNLTVPTTFDTNKKLEILKALQEKVN